MERHEIIDHLEYIQNKVDKMGFKGQNEYDLHLREEIADWLLRQFVVIKSLPKERVVTIGHEQNCMCNHCQLLDKIFGNVL